jgi:hypothetical protein
MVPSAWLAVIDYHLCCHHRQLWCGLSRHGWQALTLISFQTSAVTIPAKPFELHGVRR